MTLLIVLVCVAAYLGIGFMWAAPRYVTIYVEDCVSRFAILVDDPGRLEEWRREGAAFAIAVAFVWPFYFAGRRLLRRIAAAAAPSSYELKIQNKQQAKRIADLERDLGIGPS